MSEDPCAAFLRWALPPLELAPDGFRRVRGQVCKRLRRRMQALGIGGPEAYRKHVESHADEWAVIEGMCRISVSRFYRDRRVFDVIRDDVLPQLARAALERGDDRLSVWSAGCAGGEEPYTLALIWRFAVGRQFPGVELRILATDADPRALERARAGCYRPSSMKELPRAWRAAFEARLGLLCLDPAVRLPVELRQHDLRDPPPAGPFDLVLCRNLLFTYFAEPLRTQRAQELVASMRPGGVLVIGARESLEPTPLGLEPHPSGVAGVTRRSTPVER